MVSVHPVLHFKTNVFKGFSDIFITKNLIVFVRLIWIFSHQYRKNFARAQLMILSGILKIILVNTGII